MGKRLSSAQRTPPEGLDFKSRQFVHGFCIGESWRCALAVARSAFPLARWSGSSLKVSSRPASIAIGADVSRVAVLRRELGQAERRLREQVRSEAVRLAEAERMEWGRTRDECLQLEKIRCEARCRLEQLTAGALERFLGERELAEMALRDVERWELVDSAAYTVISFANRRDRLRFIKGGAEREAVIRETIERGGVYTEACGGRHSQEILR
jgi:hypothetical protein